MRPHEVSQLAALLFAATSTASYAFYVGSALTECHCTIIGGTGEEVSSHCLQLFPAADHHENATVVVGATADAALPGRLSIIPQVGHTFRYLSMEYSEYLGFPAPLCNGGLNEKGVGVRAVWAPNREALVNSTHLPQSGPQYSDLSKLVLQRASSAREGVQIIGDLIRDYGHTTYGGNTHLIADKNEGWVVWEFGGERLWAAERLGPHQVRALYPGAIGDFPVDFQNSTDFMAAPHLISYAVEMGWWKHESMDTFNLVKIYGLQPGEHTPAGGNSGYVSTAQLEREMLAKTPFTERDMIKLVRDPRISNDEAGYGQVVSLDDTEDPDLLKLWIAPTSSVTAPFIPWWLGVQSIPPEYGQHRYMTQASSATFLNPDFELQEASQFAGRLFKRLLYYTCSAPKLFLPIISQALIGFEHASFADIDWVERSAEILISQGDRPVAQRVLTHYSQTRANEAINLGESLVSFLDKYIKMTGRWRGPQGQDINTSPNGDPVRCFSGDDTGEMPAGIDQQALL